ncbi:hypothetical protein [Sphingomonas sp. IBVSS2]|uniref:hypothetical protein n=1 Tax=Sphingomonas sp. IBVSS2 TaxID=1985172 RepID=UPI001181874F|nr:hypothetical protein [Sphingomonas sp. IBVSS2]
MVDVPTIAQLAGRANGEGAEMIGFAQVEEGAASSDVATELRHFVRPEQYGAIGDGVADDTGAVQAAIDAAADWPHAGRARAVLLSTYYRTTATLLKRPYVSIIGIGLARSGIVPEMSSGPAIDCGGVIDTSIQYDDLRNFGIKGDGATGAAYALRLEGQKHGRLERMGVLNFAHTSEHALQIVGGCYAIVLDQCYFFNNAKHQKIAATDPIEHEFPTTILHRACVYEDTPPSTAEAILVEDAVECSWDKDCIFQSNRQKYLFSVTAGTTRTATQAHVWDGCYIEGNGNAQSDAQTWHFVGSVGNPLTGCRIVHPRIHGTAPRGRHIHAAHTDLLNVQAHAEYQGWLHDGGNNSRYDIDARYVGTCDLQTHAYSRSRATFTGGETVTYAQGVQEFTVVKQATGLFDVNLSRAFTSAVEAAVDVIGARDANGNPLQAAAYMDGVNIIKVRIYDVTGSSLVDPARVEIAVQGQLMGIME